MNDRLAEILEINPLPANTVSTLVTEDRTVQAINGTVTDDADYAKQNIRTLIETGIPTLRNLIQIANDSQHPRAFEVATQLISAMAGLNKDLLEIHKRELEITQKQQTSQTPASINVKNAVFLGTTKALQDELKNHVR